MSAKETSPEPGAQRLFPYSNPEPWSWIPGTWVQPGIVFVTGEGRFYRFIERTDDGWKTEEVEPREVGDQSRVADIRGLKARYEEVLAAHDELDREMREGKDTLESRTLLHERDEELHRLRDRVILLCNGRSPEARAAAQPDQDYWKWLMIAALAVVFVASLVYCVRSLLAIVPEQTEAMLAGAAFFISATILSVIGVRELAKRRNRLVTANLVGCFALITIVVVAAAFGIMLYAVMLHYTGGI